MSGANRNSPCPCGSGKKYKKCCALKTKLERMNATVLTKSSQKAGDLLMNQFKQFGQSYTEVVKKAEESPKDDERVDESEIPKEEQSEKKEE